MMLSIHRFEEAHFRGLVIFHFKDQLRLIEERAGLAFASFVESVHRQQSDSEATKLRIITPNAESSQSLSMLNTASSASQRSFDSRLQKTSEVFVLGYHLVDSKKYLNLRIPSWLKISVENKQGDVVALNGKFKKQIWTRVSLEDNDIFLHLSLFAPLHRPQLYFMDAQLIRISSLLHKSALPIATISLRDLAPMPQIMPGPVSGGEENLEAIF